MSRIFCEAILFDLDGVLVNSLPLIERILREWAAEHGLDGDEAVARSHGRRDIDLIALIAPHLNAAREARAIAEREETAFLGLQPVAGASSLLAGLPPGTWGVVTSGTRLVARGRLAAAGLREPAVLLTAEDFERGKPDPEGYLKGAAALSTRPERCVVVEDSEAGVRAALSAGMHCIGVGRNLLDRTSDALLAVVDNLTGIRVTALEQGLLLETDPALAKGSPADAE